ncbi:amidohydrolase [Desulfocucumis palustris]|uniref:amidohydrolase n=1 Tax=Desulfocucumis palustris TaxID=1898651 RepID=UPI000CEA54E9|nr:amidohydrolase [Desulfocucumis palustris]
MLAIKGGRVYTMAGKVYDTGTVLIDGKVIADVYQGNKIPAGAKTVDASGKMVFPGFIDAHSHLGIVEEIYREEGDDCNEITDPVTPHLRAVDAIYPEDLGFADALSGGVTTVVTGPGSANVLGGEMVAIKTHGRLVEHMVVKYPVGLKAALGENPKRSYGSQKKSPYTRMASAALIREALAKAGDYIRKMEKCEQGNGEQPDRDLKMEALARVLKGEIPLRVHAHRADDIMTAVRLAEEFGVRLVVEHCTEGYKVAPELASRGVMAVLGPVITNRAKVELQGITLENARILAEAGVTFGIMTDHPVVPIQYLSLSAGLTVRGGLTEERALRAITLDAAGIIGMEDRLGSLEPGKDADIAIFEGHPFDTRTRVGAVIVSGEKVIG